MTMRHKSLLLGLAILLLAGCDRRYVEEELNDESADAVPAAAAMIDAQVDIPAEVRLSQDPERLEALFRDTIQPILAEPINTERMPLETPSIELAN